MTERRRTVKERVEKILGPAEFSGNDLTRSPAEVEEGEATTISVKVANIGGESGSYTVTLRIDNVVVDTKVVTVNAGSSQTVTFTTSKDVAGTYTVDVNGLSKTFTVTKAPSNWWISLIVGLGAAVTVGLLVYFLWWRRRVV